MRCTSCDTENPEGAKFCVECGAPFLWLCPSCGQQMPPTAKFCPECGAPLKAPGKPGPAKRRKGVNAVRQTPRAGTRPTTAKPHAVAREAERRQLTVMFCDLVGSTALSAQLDPEDYRAVVQQYQQASAAVVDRFEGHLAQYLGDGLLVYFGYPTAHEDDARRAVRTGLEIVEAIRRQARQQPLQVRIGIHTGLVVVGEIGAGSRTEQLALGETPNVAARIQGLAEPNTVIVSAATHRLIEGQFECQPFGSHVIKGLETPLALYHVQSERQDISPLAGRTTLTPLVGREQEVGLLLDRWEQAKEGRGQVVLLSGEPGIGKSRLAYTLREHVASEGSLLFEACCSPYHQHSALYPLIEVLQRTLLFTRQDSDRKKVEKLERALRLYNLQESLPLFTGLLSLPTPPQYPPLTLTPQKQKERTLQAQLQLLIAQAERQATVSVWEDLHWADPSSLEFLTLLIEQIPTTKLLLLLTFRPEFMPPWKSRSHISQLVLNRLGKRQVEVMIQTVAADKGLSAEIVEQVRIKTDGVPLFVEELTKNVLESVEALGSLGSPHRTALPLAIPATLQEALLARLDRLAEARQVAQLGATLGREFSYELIQAVAPLSETELHAALNKLVEGEILYQRGPGEQVRYFFKHALIQDTAYQSLLKSTRQQYHQQIAQVLEERFPNIKENQPELLAHHYTEAGLIGQAIPYWQQAGQRATQRSANVEAISHLTKGLELLTTLPDTPERAQQELSLQIALGSPLIATKGFAAPEVASAYTRARELCQQLGETPQLFPVLFGLFSFYGVAAEHKTARGLADQLLSLAHRQQAPTLLMPAHVAFGAGSVFLGEPAVAREHLEQGIALYDPQKHSPEVFGVALDLGVNGRVYAALALWFLGYPDQALKRSQEALTLARALSHPHSLAFALGWAARLHQLRRERQQTHEQAEAAISLSTDQEFPIYLALGTILQGWALAEQGQAEEGLAQMRQGLAAWRATGAGFNRPYFLALLAAAYGNVGQTEEGLSVVAEALMLVNKTRERSSEAELYRLKGQLVLQAGGRSPKSGVSNTQHPTPSTHAEAEAEVCFLKAIEIARQQQAKSLELRAAMSLSRLWQQQGKQDEARQMMAEVYGWFTEGFDTKDLQEAKVLLEELSSP
jgi:class 3 adenylate cyclase/predicted ATPase